jgi:hypothetical protein
LLVGLEGDGGHGLGNDWGMIGQKTAFSQMQLVDIKEIFQISLERDHL